MADASSTSMAQSMAAFAAMSPEQKREHLDYLRARFESLPPEEQRKIMAASRRQLQYAQAHGIPLIPLGDRKEEESSSDEEATVIKPSECALSNRNKPQVVTTQPVPSRGEHDEMAEVEKEKRKRLRMKRKPMKPGQWARVRSLHFSRGHWSAPIRYEKNQWRTYATVDEKYGPWQKEISLLSYDLSRFERLDLKDHALGLLKAIKSRDPDFVAIEGARTAIAGLLMNDNIIKKRYWVNLGSNLTQNPTHTTKSVITLSRIPPIKAESLIFSSSKSEAIACHFVVNGEPLKIVAASAPECDGDFDAECPCDRSFAVSHLLSSLPIPPIHRKESSKQAQPDSNNPNTNNTPNSDKKPGTSKRPSELVKNYQLKSKSVKMPDLILLGDLRCSCNGTISGTSGQFQEISGILRQKAVMKEGKEKGGERGEGVWMTGGEAWVGVAVDEPIDCSPARPVVAEVRSTIQPPISAVPKSGIVADCQNKGPSRPSGQTGKDELDQEGCIVQ